MLYRKSILAVLLGLIFISFFGTLASKACGKMRGGAYRGYGEDFKHACRDSGSKPETDVKGAMNEPIREGLEDWLSGCDV